MGSPASAGSDLDHAPGAIRVIDYSGSGRLVASTTRSGMERPLVVEPDGSVLDFPFEDVPGELRPASISEDGLTLLLVGAHRTVERLVVLDVDSGQLRSIEGITGDLNSWGGAGTFLRSDGKVVVTREDGTMLPEVLLVDPADGKVLETLLPTTPVPESRPFRSLDVPTTGDATAQGWLMTPEGPGPFPTILDIHGGPQAHELDRFFPDAQAWVDRGFAFFTLNYRGSTGFGREYEQAIWGAVGRRELDDMVAARETLVREGIADPDRVVLHGGSYGGYLTLLGLGRRPDLWAGGVAFVAIADWRMLYEDGEGPPRLPGGAVRRDTGRDAGAARRGLAGDVRRAAPRPAADHPGPQRRPLPGATDGGLRRAGEPAREGRHDRLVRCRARPWRDRDPGRVVPPLDRVRRVEARHRRAPALGSGGSG